MSLPLVVGWALGAASSAAASDRYLGQQFGHYRAVDVLGEGGMGVVLKGERLADDFDRFVAIKIVAASPAHQALRERFLTERRILANLNHPNIGQLFDAGTTKDGLPFLIMELVDGLPIDEFCRGQGVSTNKKLELMIQGHGCCAIRSCTVGYSSRPETGQHTGKRFRPS